MKNIIITGTSRGIGFELAQLFAKNNYQVLALSRNTAPLENLNMKNITTISVDLPTKNDLKKVADFVDKNWKQVDILINNFFTYSKNNVQIVEARNLHAANFTNCIIDGNSNIELVIDKAEGTVFNYSFKNNLLRFKEIVDTNHYLDNIFNGTPHFKSPETNELIIGEKSDAVKKGSEAGRILVPNDILGVTRTAPPDIGAYQHIIFN